MGRCPERTIQIGTSFLAGFQTKGGALFAENLEFLKNFSHVRRITHRGIERFSGMSTIDIRPVAFRCFGELRMSDFFRGRKRKLEIATLAIACALAGCWVRNFWVIESFAGDVE
jgi:hypothetical protein